MSKKEKQPNARQRAYQQKQENEGNAVMKWIFAILLILAIAYMAFSIYLV